MRPLRTRLIELRQLLGTPLETLERDYLLSWVLFGLSREPGLAGALAFKGGTALKKCYFGDYRFSEDLEAAVRTYRLEEIVAEKLGALLQHARLLEERGWTRSRARDYYDLWRIFQAYEDELSLEGFVDLLERKCATREVRFDGVDSFFDESMVTYVRDTWHRSLGSLVPDLPDHAILLAELEERLAELLR